MDIYPVGEGFPALGEKLLGGSPVCITSFKICMKGNFFNEKIRSYYSGGYKGPAV